MYAVARVRIIARNHNDTNATEGSMNDGIRIYPGRDGWFYEVWAGARLVIFGWCATQERAQFEAATA